jgi:hypothetical protein
LYTFLFLSLAGRPIVFRLPLWRISVRIFAYSHPLIVFDSLENFETQKRRGSIKFPEVKVLYSDCPFIALPGWMPA